MSIGLGPEPAKNFARANGHWAIYSRPTCHANVYAWLLNLLSPDAVSEVKMVKKMPWCPSLRWGPISGTLQRSPRPPSWIKREGPRTEKEKRGRWKGGGDGEGLGNRYWVKDGDGRKWKRTKRGKRMRRGRGRVCPLGSPALDPPIECFWLWPHLVVRRSLVKVSTPGLRSSEILVSVAAT